MKHPIDQALRFLRIAEKDLRAFYVLKTAAQIDLSIICFHAQQVVEKCLKAVLIYYDKNPTRTHDLNNIAYLLTENEITLPLSIEEISKLNPYAVTFRYDDTDIEILTRDEAQQIVEAVYNWTKEIIES
jgi:HEPN domain-containing protein